MQRLSAIGLLVLSMLVMAASAGAARRHRHRTPAKCTQVHARLITADGQAQVYEATEPEAFPEYLGAWGCVYGHGRPYFLGPLPYGSASGAGGVEHETLAGSIVAYEEASIGGSQSGRAVAWIAEDYERSGTAHGTEPSYFDVYAVDKSGTRLLASGTDIDPSSLAFSVTGTNIGEGSRTAIGSTLYWTQGGKSASAVLN